MLYVDQVDEQLLEESGEVAGKAAVPNGAKQQAGEQRDYT